MGERRIKRNRELTLNLDDLHVTALEVVAAAVWGLGKNKLTDEQSLKAMEEDEPPSYSQNTRPKLAPRADFSHKRCFHYLHLCVVYKLFRFTQHLFRHLASFNNICFLQSALLCIILHHSALFEGFCRKPKITTTAHDPLEVAEFEGGGGRNSSGNSRVLPTTAVKPHHFFGIR